jgi:transcriptional regulator GlxA family with amidase domain
MLLIDHKSPAGQVLTAAGITRRVGILVYENVTMIDVAGPPDVFSHANAVGASYETRRVMNHRIPSPTAARAAATRIVGTKACSSVG